MKRTTLIALISFLIPILGMSQTKSTFIDDLYLKPSEAKAQQASQSQLNQQTQNTKPISKYKNGAKEIRYIERENPTNKVFHDTVYVDGKEYVDGKVNKNSDHQNKEGIHDTIYVVGQDNDSIERSQRNGSYQNGFNGTESDLEYAKRIRQFHNPGNEIIISEPGFNDINNLNNDDLNESADSTNANVAPTWINPYWWNYNYSPYCYGYMGFGFNNFYSPYSYYPGWFDYPWGFDDFYGDFGFGFGYGDYYGYDGYGYGYGYGGYGNYGWGNNWSGRKNDRNTSHDEGTRRDVSNLSGSGRVGGINNSAQGMSGGGGYSSTNPYTVVSNTGLRKSASQNTVSKTSVSRINNPSSIQSTSRTLSTNRYGIGLVRSNGLRNLTNLNQNSNINSGSRSITTYTINTTPRTNRNTLSTNPMIVNSGTNRVNNVTNTYTNSGNYSTVSRSSSSNSSPVITNSSVSRSSSSYSSGNSNYSSGSSSRSSGSYSGGSSGSSSGGSSGGGGSRSSGGGGGGGSRR